MSSRVSFAPVATPSWVARLPLAPMPREHGAWIMLFAPLAIGVLAPRGPDAPRAALLVAAALAMFLGQDVIRRLWRGQRTRGLRVWLGIWSSLAAVAGVTLLTTHPSLELVLVGVAGAVLLAVELAFERIGRKAMQKWSDVLAAAGLSLAAPAALMMVDPTRRALAALVWLGCVTYFASSVVHVRLLLAEARLRRVGDQAIKRAALPSLAYHLLLGAAVAYVARSLRPDAGLAVAVAYAPAVVRGLWEVARARGRSPSLKRAGVLESLYAVWFAGFLSWALWL